MQLISTSLMPPQSPLYNPVLAVLSPEAVRSRSHSQGSYQTFSVIQPKTLSGCAGSSADLTPRHLQTNRSLA